MQCKAPIGFFRPGLLEEISREDEGARTTASRTGAAGSPGDRVHRENGNPAGIAIASSESTRRRDLRRSPTAFGSKIGRRIRKPTDSDSTTQQSGQMAANMRTVEVGNCSSSGRIPTTVGPTQCICLHADRSRQALRRVLHLHRLEGVSPHQVTEELHRLQSEGVISRAPSDCAVYPSPLTVVGKAAGGVRVCVNMRAMNQRMLRTHFKMEGLLNVRDLIAPGAWMTSLDIRDAYMHVPIALQDRKFIATVDLEY